jgi:hypothetical protein
MRSKFILTNCSNRGNHGTWLNLPSAGCDRFGRPLSLYSLHGTHPPRDRGIINSLQELDFDNNLGKIPEDEYAPQRALLLQKGAEILRKLDELSSPSPLVPLPKGEGNHEDAEARIEKEVSAHRADSPAQAAELSDDDIESMLAARRKQHKEKSAGFCPKCGKPVLVTDRFCPACGKSLT